jgi:hypothetical protein
MTIRTGLGTEIPSKNRKKLRLSAKKSAAIRPWARRSSSFLWTSPTTSAPAKAIP